MSVSEDLTKAYIPERLETMNSFPYVILDGCHNLQGVSTIVEAMRQYFPSKMKELFYLFNI